MGGETIRQIIISIANFDWAITIPFIICVTAVIMVLRDTDKDVETQNKILNTKPKSRYN